jgi:hypothetical protein
MTKYVSVFFLFLSAIIHGYSQEPAVFPSIDINDIPDARFETPKTFTGPSLFGYMDGGAELYLEYGFSGAWMDELNYRGGEYAVEIYRMNGTEEAFGIFSVSRYKCSSTPALSPFTCQTPYQLQVCSGPFYINIINQSGKPGDSIASLQIGAAIVKKIKDKPADLTLYLPDVLPETINRDAVLVKGKLGVMNGVADLEDFFGDATGYCAVILRLEKETIISVRFQNREALEAFESRHAYTPETPAAGSAAIPAGDVVKRISDTHLIIILKK